jgi:hypothetical protein
VGVFNIRGKTIVERAPVSDADAVWRVEERRVGLGRNGGFTRRGVRIGDDENGLRCDDKPSTHFTNWLVVCLFLGFGDLHREIERRVVPDSGPGHHRCVDSRPWGLGGNDDEAGVRDQQADDQPTGAPMPVSHESFSGPYPVRGSWRGNGNPPDLSVSVRARKAKPVWQPHVNSPASPALFQESRLR